MNARLRPSQQRILEYRRGKMGISAVPGSGKTWTLSLLATQLITRGHLAADQEVLVVTLVNSAVDNFSSHIGEFVAKRGLLPNLGYRVRTLHGLANDIVREAPGLVGLDAKFSIIDEGEANRIITQAAADWLYQNGGLFEGYLNPTVEETSLSRVRRTDLPNLVKSMGLNFIRYAKDQQQTPEALAARLDKLSLPLPLAQMGVDLYTSYQRSLAYRGAVDFDDLIRLALQALQTDPSLLDELRYRWPFILEDEAQDSSRLQEQILRLLAGQDGNWVRVGDPNQAIYETFTTASPRYLIDFLHEPGVVRHELPESGRSTRSIITLANQLVEWTVESHPLLDARQALTPPLIRPTGKEDPQPNPPDQPEQVILKINAYTPDEEIRLIANSLERWLPAHPDATVAVLAPTNQRGFDIVAELERRHIDFVDSLLRSSASTRSSSTILRDILFALADPKNQPRLVEAYRAWRSSIGPAEEDPQREKIQNLLRGCTHIEDYLWPASGDGWLVSPGVMAAGEDVFAQLKTFRALMQRWQQACQLPVDQLVLTLAQDLFTQTNELAVAYRLAGVLRQAANTHPTWNLPELSEELAQVAQNERRLMNFEEDNGFQPEAYRGRVVVGTLHKAKGLEWDRVYLTSINNYDFPSGQPQDTYYSEKWFLRDHINLEAEIIEQLDVLLSDDEYRGYQEGEATLYARHDLIRERLRLLYVGITRARKELIITCNSGRTRDKLSAVPLVALSAFWEVAQREHPR